MPPPVPLLMDNNAALLNANYPRTNAATKHIDISAFVTPKVKTKILLVYAVIGFQLITIVRIISRNYASLCFSVAWPSFSCLTSMTRSKMFPKLPIIWSIATMMILPVNYLYILSMITMLTLSLPERLFLFSFWTHFRTLPIHFPWSSCLCFLYFCSFLPAWWCYCSSLTLLTLSTLTNVLNGRVRKTTRRCTPLQTTIIPPLSTVNNCCFYLSKWITYSCLF